MKILLVLFFAAGGFLFGQETGYGSESPKNEISVFIGGTSFIDHQGNYFSSGIDFVRKIDEHFAIGILGEAILAEHTEYILAVPLYYSMGHPWLRVAPGIEVLTQEKDDHQGGTETEHHTEFLLRVGAGYALHYGHWVVSPSLDVDFVRTTVAAVYGLNIGYVF